MFKKTYSNAREDCLIFGLGGLFGIFRLFVPYKVFVLLVSWYSTSVIGDAREEVDASKSSSQD